MNATVLTAQFQLCSCCARSKLVGGPAGVLVLILCLQMRNDAHLFVALVNQRELWRVHQFLAAPEPLDVGLRVAAHFALTRDALAGSAVLIAQRRQYLWRLSLCTRQEFVVFNQCRLRLARIVDGHDAETVLASINQVGDIQRVGR